MKKLVLLISIMMLLGACSSHNDPISKFLKPLPMGIGHGPDNPPDGPPDFQLGWREGCETGMSTLVPTYHKMFYKFKQRPEMLTNPAYHKAWKDSYTYCRHYAFKWTFWSWDTFDYKP